MEKTDLANENDRPIEDLDECAWCGRFYDPNCEGHDDEATGLQFCQVTCEDQYDCKNGLLEEYVQAQT